MRILFITFIISLLFSINACAQDVPVTPPKEVKQVPEKQPPPAPGAPRMPTDRNKFALIISGIGGEESYTRQFSKWTNDLQKVLIEKLGFAEDQVITLCEKPVDGQGRATAQAVREAFGKFREAAGPDQPVFVFMIGHGSFDDKIAKFNLIGPDLAASDYAQLIKGLPSRQLTVINMASASGEFIKPLSGNGRIVVTATRSGAEQNATQFAEYFIAALANPEADADKNGRVSVLEAFNYASKLTGDSFKQAGKLLTEHAIFDDNGDGVGHAKAESGDGALAKTTYFDSLPQQLAGGNPVLAKLFSERMRLEGEIEQLKVRKEQMSEDDYETALEKLLIELAKVNREIKAQPKNE